jgi:hypothetical protein
VVEVGLCCLRDAGAVINGSPPLNGTEANDVCASEASRSVLKVTITRLAGNG